MSSLPFQESTTTATAALLHRRHDHRSLCSRAADDPSIDPPPQQDLARTRRAPQLGAADHRARGRDRAHGREHDRAHPLPRRRRLRPLHRAHGLPPDRGLAVRVRSQRHRDPLVRERRAAGGRLRVADRAPPRSLDRCGGRRTRRLRALSAHRRADRGRAPHRRRDDPGRRQPDDPDGAAGAARLPPRRRARPDGASRLVRDVRRRASSSPPTTPTAGSSRPPSGSPAGYLVAVVVGLVAVQRLSFPIIPTFHRRPGGDSSATPSHSGSS